MGDTTIKEVEEIPLEDGRITFNPNLEPIQSFLRRFPPSSTSATLAGKLLRIVLCAHYAQIGSKFAIPPWFPAVIALTMTLGL